MAGGGVKRGGKSSKRRRKICMPDPYKRKYESRAVDRKNDSNSKQIQKKTIQQFDSEHETELEEESVVMTTNRPVAMTTTRSNSKNASQSNTELVAMTTASETSCDYASLVPKPVVMTTTSMDTLSSSTIDLMRNIMELNIESSVCCLRRKKDQEQGKKMLENIMARVCVELSKVKAPVENRIEDYSSLEDHIKSKMAIHSKMCEEIESGKQLIRKRTRQLKFLQEAVNEIKRKLSDGEKNERKRTKNKNPPLSDIHVLKKRKTRSTQDKNSDSHSSFLTRLQALADSDSSTNDNTSS